MLTPKQWERLIMELKAAGSLKQPMNNKRMAGFGAYDWLKEPDGPGGTEKQGHPPEDGNKEGVVKT